MKKTSLLVGLTILALSPLSAGIAAAPAAPAVDLPAEPVPEVQTNPLQFPVVGTLADGRTFTGTFVVTKLYLDATGKLLVDGVLTGVVGSGDEGQVIEQVVTGISSTLNEGRLACDVLNLDLGPLNLDLLGLVVDLEPVILDITAESGSGNLVGNLLCAVVNLLNNPLASILELADLLGQISDILSGD